MIGGAAGRDEACKGVIPALVIGIGLALANWHVLMMPIDISAVAPPAPQPIAATSATEHLADAAPSLTAEAFPVTLARPLFRDTRRPPDPAKPEIADARAVEPPKPVRLPDGLALIGIVKESGDSGRALIRSPASGTGQWVEVGHLLEGWRLSRIETGSILFEAEGHKQSLSLFPQKGE
jgi:general secretion pathway protein N